MSDGERPRPDFRLVPIELVDPPPIAMREEMDDAGLEALAANIKRNGVLQPPGVIATPDGRFRISWGHRRLEAAKLAGETMLPVRIVDDATKEEELKVAENYHQEPVNPVAEAQILLNQLGFDAGDANGRMGSRTANSIRLFELQSGMRVTGEVTQELLAKLRARLG